MRFVSRTWLPAVAAALLMASSAAAQTKPFGIIGAGTATSGLPLPGQPGRTHTSVGFGSFLGLYTGTGQVQTDTAVPQPNGTIAGDFGSATAYTFTGDDGDQLVTWYGRTDKGAAAPGTFVIVPQRDGRVVAHFLAEFVVDGAASTGKFRGVTGSWLMYAVTEPFVLGSTDPTDYAWVGSGSLTFPRGGAGGGRR
jgi:hypothetical protein